MNRREFLAGPTSAAGIALLELGEPPKFKLGTVTYNIAASWDLETLLKTCKAAEFEAIELRTTHAHKVEPGLGADERRDAKKKIQDSGLVLWGFGTVCEFHATDEAVVRRNVQDCRAFCRLAADLGAKGVKVRPNALPRGVEPARTLDQIGRALSECGKAASDAGVEIWVEVHGSGTAEPANMRTMIDACGHPSVGICWNSNSSDVKNGSVAEAFELLKKDIKSCHINEFWSGYPYRELFSRLKGIGYDRVTLMEVGGVPEAAGAKEPAAALRFMRYYRTLWKELTA
jgi:sugar phosphate isomerase/epimerase